MTCLSNGAELSATGLSWGPRPSLLLVRDVEFSIAAGDRMAIIGPNGAGKSSLLRCLYRAHRPLRGTVHLDGEDINGLAARDVARRIAVVLQEMPADFPFSVRDVAMMGRIPHREGLAGWTDRDRATVAHALDHLGLASLAGRQFATLSGGEKQRVLVARALAQEPRIVILDEPTNHLDIRHQLELLELLRQLGLTIVTTLHDINLAADFATRVAVLKDGRLAAFGTPDSVLGTALLSDVFGVSAVAQSADRTRRFHFTIAN
ncbi:ABC transporter ATP-binding protein [Rhizobium sp. TRM95111]|uniref:ABC transporter ATP-binding protein n=1 Tax=Rhizobium alarense TaxID=2846851 RepID=UPI001F307C51|nr:ABC transporter ATP-binding protein [Rhizobium alarense]MCF3640516.1 ABC transporter ATP-binding protein [Rhizobium alarense]